MTYSQTFSNGVWSNGGGATTITQSTTAIAPDGSATAVQLLAQTQYDEFSNTSITLSPGTYIISLWVRRDAGTNVLSLETTTGINIGNYSPTSTWTRYYFKYTSDVAFSFFTFQDKNTSGFTSTQIWGVQIEAVTYQTTPSPYIATGASAYYGPKFDYGKGLRIWKQETNISYDLSTGANSTLSSGLITITPNSGISPDGANNAYLLSFTNTVNNAPEYNYINQSYTSNNSGVYSIYAKANTYQYLILDHSLYADYSFAVFDLSSGSVALQPTYTGANAQIIPVSNGWYRCILNTPDNNGAQNGSSAYVVVIGASSVFPTDLVSFVNTNSPNVGAVLIWGLDGKINNDTFTSPYIPTFNTSITSAADVPSFNSQVTALIQTNPCIYQWLDGATNTLQVVRCKAGQFTWPNNGWLQKFKIYPVGTSLEKMTVY